MSYVAMSVSTRWRSKLKDARERSKFTQEGLADELAITQSSVDKYENGHASPRLDTLLTMARVLDISLDWLFDDSREESLETERAFRRAVKKLGGVDHAYNRLALFDGSYLPPAK